MHRENDDALRRDYCAAPGGTPSAHWAPSLIQRYAWVEGTKATRNSQMNKYKEFAEGERRGMTPGEIDLVCYVAWLLCEGRVQVSSFRQYLSAVRTFVRGTE